MLKTCRSVFAWDGDAAGASQCGASNVVLFAYGCTAETAA
jgi:hypothetical protein